MLSSDRIKRRMLRQVVHENVATMEGRLPLSLRRGYRWLRVASRSAGLLAVLLGVSASAYVLHEVTSAPDDLVVITQVMAPSPAEATATAPETTASSLPAPTPIEPAVLRLGVQRVMIDPGHGGGNVGTVAPGGQQEKEITLDISLRLRDLLRENGFEALMTRDRDTFVNLDDRTRVANAAQADIFVSIHVNWLETEGVRGVETYYLGPTDDPYLTRMAAAENRGSQYSLADFRQLVESLYRGVRQDESRRLAQAIQRRLLHSLRTVNPQLRDRGVKTAPFVVLVSSEMPAVLVEVACLSDREEAALLAKPFYRQFIAQSLFDGIRSYADSLVPTEEEL